MLQIFSSTNFSINVAGSKTDNDVAGKKSTLPIAFSVDSKDTVGMTWLLNAVVYINVQAVESLIEIGANPSLMSDKRWNALHFAAQIGNIGINDLIQNHLPNINSKTKAGQTPLMIAASFGNLDAVKWKWKCFRDCNILRFYRLSIYLCAVCKGHVLCNIFGIERLLSLKFTS